MVAFWYSTMMSMKKIVNKKKTTQPMVEQPVIYQSKSGALELRGDATAETVWATQAQMAQVFEIDRSVVTRHINNILKTNEVDKKSNVQKMHIANSDKPVAYYSLDIILAVGYRTNSARAITFRQWATKTLRQHITQGFTINREHIGKNYEAFMEAVEQVRALVPPQSELGSDAVLDLVTLFADTWLSLDAYDREVLVPEKVSKKKVRLTSAELAASLQNLKAELCALEQANENFAQERNRDSLEGIVGNVMQSFGGKAVYPSVQEKAAHLLYFIIKNHPFVDGNKRSAAYAFVWYLERAKLLDTKQMTPTALTALTLLIAESNPNDKDKMVRLVVMLLGQ